MRAAVGLAWFRCIAVRGEGLRAYDRAIRNYGQNVTLLASMSVQGMQAAMTLEGAEVDATALKLAGF